MVVQEPFNKYRAGTPLAYIVRYGGNMLISIALFFIGLYVCIILGVFAIKYVIPAVLNVTMFSLYHSFKALLALVPSDKSINTVKDVTLVSSIMILILFPAFKYFFL